MVANLLLPILKRLESEPPLFCADEVRSSFGPAIAWLEELDYLRRARPKGVWICTACSGHACRVQFLQNAGTKAQSGYYCCPECGVSPIDKDRLKRWRVNVEQLLRAVSDVADIKGTATETVPGLVWRLGKAGWAGCSREVFFVRRHRKHESAKIAAALSRRPKAIIFTTIDPTAEKLAACVPNVTIALESAVSLGPDHSMCLDGDHIAARIAEAATADRTPAKRPAKRRSTRTADIDALERELIRHIKDARDHAVDSRDRRGAAILLTRPNKAKLGQLAGVKPHSVTRCFQDSERSQAAAALGNRWRCRANPHIP